MTTPPSTRRAVIYVRISKDRKQEVSTTIQRETAERYCQSKGWTVVAVHEDRGRSAYKRNIKRSALDATMSDIEAGVADVLVVYRLDRVSRSVADFAVLWARLAAAGCQFVSTGEQFDTSSSMGEAMLNIAMVFAQLESAIKSERGLGVHELRKATGAPPTGPRPFGYTVVKGGDRTVNKSEAKLIRSAAKRVVGGDSLRSIVAEWNAAGVVTANGRPWSNRALRHILVSPHTAGMREIEGVLVEGQWDAVLDRATHEALVAVMGDPARRTTTGNAPAHLLSGFAVCELCKTPLGAKPHLTGPRYTCGPRRGFVGCGRQSINAELADKFVTAAVLDALDRSTLAKVIEGQRADPGLVVDQLESELEQLAVDYGSGAVSQSEWKAARPGIEQRLETARRSATRSRSAAPLRLLRDAHDPAVAFRTLPFAQQRLVLLAVLDGVGIKPATRGQDLTGRIVLDGYWRS